MGIVMDLAASLPLVSVIIPTYNRRDLVGEAIKSVRMQTYPNYEIIVVDDGSDDGSDGLSGEKDLVYLRLAHSGMAGRVRNAGVDAARGKLVAFLDSDDLWRPQKLELQVPSCGRFRITHTRELWLRNGVEVSQKGQRHRREGMIFEDSLRKCIIGPSTVMMERSLFTETGGFREDIEIGEDYEYWLRITPANKVGYVDEPLTVKRAGHGDQLTEKYGHIEIFRIEALLNLLQGGGIPGRLQPSAATELARKCRIYAAGARKRGKIDEAERYEAVAADWAPA